MTPEEQRNLFKGTMTVVRGALRLDDNEALFEAAWTETDPVEFINKLEHFAIGLAASAARFYPDLNEEQRARIRADVKVVVDRIGWHWALWRTTTKGKA